MTVSDASSAAPSQVAGVSSESVEAEVRASSIDEVMDMGQTLSGAVQGAGTEQEPSVDTPGGS